MGNSFSHLTGSLGGSHWGLIGSVGMSVKYRRVEFEPFIQGGWQRLRLDTASAVIEGETFRLERERESILVAAGLAVKF